MRVEGKSQPQLQERKVASSLPTGAYMLLLILLVPSESLVLRLGDITRPSPDLGVVLRVATSPFATKALDGSGERRTHSRKSSNFNCHHTVLTCGGQRASKCNHFHQDYIVRS